MPGRPEPDDAAPIAAIATAPGAAGISIIRVSGSGSLALGDRLVDGASKPSCRPAGTFFHTFLRDPRTGDRLDDVLLLVFRAPHSYTGEETLEIQCHGGRIPARKILGAVLAAGARPARPGEFTQRAFLNGRLDLTQAEALCSFIQAETEKQSAVARAQLDGSLGTRVNSLYAEAVRLSAEVEHALDFEEGELPETFAPAVAGSIDALAASVTALAETWGRGGRLLREGALVVISGAPNAGKSSLMNALLGRDRAIVNSRPGTTRDAIEEGYSLSGIPIRLVDTAGLRETQDEIERDGIARTRKLMAEADLNLALLDATALGPASSLPTVPPRTLLVLTKADLAARLPAGALAISSKTGYGLPELGRAILKALGRAETEAGSDEIVSARQAAELRVALENLHAARPLCSADWVLAANRLRAAAEALGRITGRVYTADLLDTVFSRFCVGK